MNLLDLKETTGIDTKMLKQTFRIIGLTTIGAFIALLIFSYFFPVQISVENIEQESKTTIGFDPLALTALKIWNGANLESQSVQLDECNKAERMDNDNVTWKITLKNC